MYKIIGADGRQYEAANLDELRRWIAEGRVNAQTLVQVGDGTEWKALSTYPELAPLVPPTAPVLAPGTGPGSLPPLGGPASFSTDPARQVQGPAIGLVVTAVLGLITAFSGLAMNFFGVAMGPFRHQGGDQMERLINTWAGGLGIVEGVVHLALSGLILYGGLKMMKLQQYHLAMVSAVVALVPCVSPCCLVGLPIGIWALVVLTKPEVKALFGPQ